MQGRQNIFYQSSLPRAGSTLLQNLIGQNPKFHVTPTSGMIDMMLGTRIGYNGNHESKAGDLNQWKEGFYAYCREGFKGYVAALTDKPYILDKNRAWLSYYSLLNEILPNPKILVMVRDLRAVFASMEKKFRANPDKDEGEINNITLQGITTQQRVEQWSMGHPIGYAVNKLNQSFLGEILLESNQYDEALLLFNNVLKINKKNINALFNLGKINFELGKFELSEDYYNKIIAAEPNNLKALYELIKINKKYLTSEKIENLKKYENQNNLNNVYASFILAENDKNLKNYKNEIDNLLKGHNDYLKTKEKAATQEFNYFTNLLPQFTKKVKNMNEADKVQIIEALWKIIYSNNDADIYETNLMRRLGGLLYIDDRIIGDIKNKIKNKVLNDLSS